MVNTKLDYAKEDTTLAKKRTMLATSRTLLSHIRTALVFISLAVAFMKLNKDKPVDAFVLALFVLSGVFLLLGIIDYIVTSKFVRHIGNIDTDEE